MREIKRLEIVLEMISTVEAERDAILTEKKSTHLNADKIKMLAKLKAIGAEFSTPLVGEVILSRIANRRQLGSYVGLASSPFCSGSLDRDQGISKAGNPKARVMISSSPGLGCAINLRARSPLVPGTRRKPQRSPASDCHRCHGAQALRSTMALYANRRRPNWRRAESSKQLKETRANTPLSKVDA